MQATFFKDQYEFRDWLEENHDKVDEFYLGLYKKGTGKENISWSEAVDQALCFGWIDGRSNSIDAQRWRIRFTPRRPNSIWSNVNIKKVEKLTAEGLMREAGMAAYAIRKPEKSGIYSFENEPAVLDAQYEKRFKKNKKAWIFFQAQPAGYKKLNIFRIMDGKQEKTRLSRLEKLIAASEIGQRL